MLFKYFLGYLPEETDLIDPSLLTVFRREGLSNKENKENEEETNLMELEKCDIMSKNKRNFVIKWR